ncbi:ATP-dependent RNA helicase HrpA [Rubritalea tangerina]|uniref:ATP-dependent RNA helicase HrpA n=2 Tax=Rubritalea tangerina TaxID=430798 RepID=A0ABW4ZCX8_9BACT
MQTVLPVKYPELSVSRERDAILKSLRDHQLTVVVGDTGSGKTTQLPKMALEYIQENQLSGCVGCTQPRRLAAASVAKRVADELEVGLGAEVGYQVRFQDNTSRATRVKFMTDGILLAETQGDSTLSRYSVLIIDEAHERSLNIDFLLGYLKLLMQRRPNLKVLISSATLDAGGFAEFFDKAPVIHVEGRTFPVETAYLGREEGEDMPRHVARAIEQISRSDRSGDILVFLPGEREIRECVDVLEGRSWGQTDILPLFARLGLKDQQRVFNPEGGRRRVVLATNVAETSLTIPRIVYVVDTGVARVSRWSPARQVQRLQVEKTSQASANQRKGRCGRISEGVCVRLYEEEDFESRQEFTDPEIRRSSLAGVILKMKALGLAAIEEFPFLDPPSSKHIAEGYRTLREVGALGEDEELTKTGRMLARIPVEPRLGKMLIEARYRGCLDAMLVIVSGLSIMDPRERPAEKAKEADTAHAQWNDEDSDFISLLHLWCSVQKFKEGRKWKQNQLRKFCRQNFVNFRRVLEWANLHHELAVLGREAFKWHSHVYQSRDLEGLDSAGLHKALLAGMPRQIGLYDKEKRAYKGAGGREFAIFPGSGLFGKKKLEWVIAYEMVDTSRLWARRVARLDPRWVEEVAPQLCRSRYHSARWDKKQGAVYAKEVVVSSGLAIVDGRNVHYGKIDPAGARAVFIREGLLGGGLKKKPDVLNLIERYREEVMEMEVKLRRRDGVWSEESVVEYFESSLPEGMSTAREFWRWMSKSAEKLQPKLNDFVYGELPDAKAFPDELHYAEECYPLYYKVAPGEVDDGVTLGVHIDQLSLFPSWLLDWGVEGQLEERTLLMIKSLPKSQRIACNPAAQTAKVFFEECMGRVPRGDYYDSLAQFLSEHSGVRIDAGMFQREKLPAELVMKLWVSDDEGNELAFGTDGDAVKEELRDLMSERFEEETGAEYDYSGMKEWECGELPEVVETAKGVGYPALVDDGESVSVRVFSDAYEAKASHLSGCIRLFLLKHADHVKYVSKNLPMDVDVKMYLPLIGGGGLNQVVLMHLIVGGCFSKEVPRDGVSFESLSEAGRGDLYVYAERMCEAMGEMIRDSREVEAWLSAHKGNANYEEIVEDVQEQVDWLFREKFATQAGWHHMLEYPQFFGGILERLKRLKSQPVVKDLEKMDRVLKLYLPWYDHWKNRPDDLAIVEAGYALERLRVQLFAPNISIGAAVSEKKIRMLLEGQGVLLES